MGKNWEPRASTTTPTRSIRCNLLALAGSERAALVSAVSGVAKATPSFLRAATDRRDRYEPGDQHLLTLKDRIPVSPRANSSTSWGPGGELGGRLGDQRTPNPQ